jgi:perosamine synthetase
LQDTIELPIEESWAHHAFWIYAILLRDDAPVGRDQFMAALDEAGIETRPVFYPMHVMPPYRQPNASYPVAESLARRGVNLPTHGLLTEEDVVYIAEQIAKVCVRRQAQLAGV